MMKKTLILIGLALASVTPAAPAQDAVHVHTQTNQVVQSQMVDQTNWIPQVRHWRRFIRGLPRRWLGRLRRLGFCWLGWLVRRRLRGRQRQHLAQVQAIRILHRRPVQIPNLIPAVMPAQLRRRDRDQRLARAHRVRPRVRRDDRQRLRRLGRFRLLGLVSQRRQHQHRPWTQRMRVRHPCAIGVPQLDPQVAVVVHGHRDVPQRVARVHDDRRQVRVQRRAWACRLGRILRTLLLLLRLRLPARLLSWLGFVWFLRLALAVLQHRRLQPDGVARNRSAHKNFAGQVVG